MQATPDARRDRVNGRHRRLGHARDHALRDAGDESPALVDKGPHRRGDLRIVQANPEHVEGQHKQLGIGLELVLGQLEAHPGEGHRIGIFRQRPGEVEPGPLPGAHHRFTAALDRRHQQVFLGLEVVVGQPGRDPRLGGDVLHRGLVVALPDQRPVGGVDDSVLGLIRHETSVS